MGKTAQPASVIVVTGSQAAGKSTVARLLAQRFERGVHIEADTLQEMIVSDGEWPTEPGDMRDEAERQLRLRLRNACLLARSFFEAGFTPVIDDIIIGRPLGSPEVQPRRASLHPHRPRAEAGDRRRQP